MLYCIVEISQDLEIGLTLSLSFITSQSPHVLCTSGANSEDGQRTAIQTNPRLFSVSCPESDVSFEGTFLPKAPSAGIWLLERAPCQLSVP